jgi:hypothetical protein
MAVKTFTPGVQLSPHFYTQEFRCKCCGKIMLDPALVTLLEKLFPALNLSRIDVISGYRCAKHDKEVGGRGLGSHVEGYAADIRCFYSDGSRVPSSVVTLSLERLGHKYGIGYRCGKVDDKAGNTHVDVKPRKWYGDESRSYTATACSSFYEYLLPFNVTVTDKTGLNVRQSAPLGRVVDVLPAGKTVRITAVNAAHTWGKTEAGWICIKDKYVRFGNM